LSAATPSYFFTPPQAGHNFFFSELLRSLVQKRKADELNAAMKAKSMVKKARKPTYHHYQKTAVESEWKKQKLSEEVTKTPETVENDMNQENSQDSVINVDKDDPPAVTSAPTLPTLAQSAFYPYVDPLHFFIDLRVSAGQIYDRKKEAYLQQALKNNNVLLDTNTWNNNPIIGRNRANSAFKVPVPGTQSEQNNFSAINLIANQQQHESSHNKGYQKIYKTSKSEDGEGQNDEDVQIFDLDKSEK
jgi:hypothetical protein